MYWYGQLFLPPGRTSSQDPYIRDRSCLPFHGRHVRMLCMEGTYRQLLTFHLAPVPQEEP